MLGRTSYPLQDLLAQLDSLGEVSLPGKEPLPLLYPHLPIVIIIDNDKMVYFAVSDKVFNDALNIAHQNSLTSVRMTKDTPDIGSFLKFRCPDALACLGTIIGQNITEIFPTIEASDLLIKTSMPPIFKFNFDGTGSLNAKGIADFTVPSPSDESILTVMIGIDAEFRIRIENGILLGQLVIRSLNLSGADSKRFDTVIINQILLQLSNLAKPFIEEWANKQLVEGYALNVPLLEGIKLMDPQVRILEHIGQVMSDVKMQ